MTKHTTTAQIIDALTNTAGDIAAAARLLGLRREAIYYRINREPDLKRIIDEQRAGQMPAEAEAEAEASDPGNVQPLSPIAENLRRQDAANLANYLRNHIAGYGLPRRYGAVIEYIGYLDKVMSGKA